MEEIVVDVLKRNMKALRVKAGYTQQDVADKLFMSRESVFRWEKDPENMTFIKLVELSKLYNCSFYDFFME